jgi:hypothetical protein
MLSKYSIGMNSLKYIEIDREAHHNFSSLMKTMWPCTPLRGETNAGHSPQSGIFDTTRILCWLYRYGEGYGDRIQREDIRQT